MCVIASDTSLHSKAFDLDRCLLTETREPNALRPRRSPVTPQEQLQFYVELICIDAPRPHDGGRVVKGMQEINANEGCIGN